MHEYGIQMKSVFIMMDKYYKVLRTLCCLRAQETLHFRNTLNDSSIFHQKQFKVKFQVIKLFSDLKALSNKCMR